MPVIFLIAVLITVVAAGASTGVTGFILLATMEGEYVFARSNPTAIVAAVMALLGYWIAASDHEECNPLRLPGVTRRAIAYLIDLFVLTSSVPALLSIPLLWAEASRTGVFHWAFERTGLVPSDIFVGVPILLLHLVLLNLYFAYPLTVGTQTIGNRLMGFRIVDDAHGTVPLGRAVIRSFLAFLAVCGFFVTIPWALIMPSKGLLWHDLAMDTIAVRLGRSE
jgi:uncharacterized RDD family membrane protein YckC